MVNILRFYIKAAKKSDAPPYKAKDNGLHEKGSQNVSSLKIDNTEIL